MNFNKKKRIKFRKILFYFFYFLNFDEDDDEGPICTLFVVPPIAIVNGDAFSCDMSVNVCCRRLNSFNLSVVN
jgi:hypothetical protein